MYVCVCLLLHFTNVILSAVNKVSNFCLRLGVGRRKDSACEAAQTNPTLECEVTGIECYASRLRVPPSFLYIVFAGGCPWTDLKCSVLLTLRTFLSWKVDLIRCAVGSYWMLIIMSGWTWICMGQLVTMIHRYTDDNQKWSKKESHIYLFWNTS